MFYEMVKELCQRKGVPLAQLAKDIHISTGTIQAWKTGSVPQGNTLRKVAEYFGVSTDYLMTGREAENGAIATADDDIEIFDAINALKREDIRRLVLRLSSASAEDVKKVNGFLDLTQIGGAYYG